ncbi:hypothetical protein P7K49_032258 [Saguinus oedipus]|uniref:Uncharacterized protein n=1 Tax=Saguinus oedipus TaxID=9490 RepID=A0ABQ9TXR5_SAGOE|nr:hypothetical protein P7K49_032258 [Saguinus oedipus]
MEPGTKSPLLSGAVTELSAVEGKVEEKACHCQRGPSSSFGTGRGSCLPTYSPHSSPGRSTPTVTGNLSYNRPQVPCSAVGNSSEEADSFGPAIRHPDPEFMDKDVAVTGTPSSGLGSVPLIAMHSVGCNWHEVGSGVLNRDDSTISQHQPPAPPGLGLPKRPRIPTAVALASAPSHSHTCLPSCFWPASPSHSPKQA